MKTIILKLLLGAHRLVWISLLLKYTLNLYNCFQNIESSPNLKLYGKSKPNQSHNGSD